FHVTVFQTCALPIYFKNGYKHKSHQEGSVTGLHGIGSKKSKPIALTFVRFGVPFSIHKTTKTKPNSKKRPKKPTKKKYLIFKNFKWQNFERCTEQLRTLVQRSEEHT